MQNGPDDTIASPELLPMTTRTPSRPLSPVEISAAPLALGSMLVAGCAHVAPYERGNLAHPTMSAEDPYTTPLAAHVQAVSEGAAGGLAGGGGGCGCN
jgi:hypothetical protein